MRIAIAHGDATHLHSLNRLIQMEGGQQIAWLARNTAEVLERMAADRPHLLLMDLDLPENAVQATQRLMAENACPILILTRTGEDQTARIFEALGAGAIDVIATPEHDAQISLEYSSAARTDSRHQSIAKSRAPPTRIWHRIAGGYRRFGRRPTGARERPFGAACRLSSRSTDRTAH